MLEIRVHEIRGVCPVHKVGDLIVIDEPEILLDKTDAICIHALPTILHYAMVLERDADPVELGLSKSHDVAYIQCVDPGHPYTEGGTVIFECCRIKGDSVE
ncbi:MAG: TIGR04076 family protein [Pseudomonadota bacterium]